jgi:hypothetical protein
MRVTDRDLERLAPRLGEDAGSRLDVDRVARQVTTRLRTAGNVPASWPIGRWLALAAGIALMAGAALVTFGSDGTPPGASVTAVALMPGLHDLSPAELDQVLDSLSLGAPTRLDGRSTLDDLDSEQLQTLLTLMEG